MRLNLVPGQGWGGAGEGNAVPSPGGCCHWERKYEGPGRGSGFWSLTLTEGVP